MIVSGLNHAVHKNSKWQSPKRLSKWLEKNNLTPGETPDFSPSTIMKNAQKLFGKAFDRTGVTRFVVESFLEVDGESVYGYTDIASDGKSITGDIYLCRTNNNTNYLLYSTVGHELNHAYHYTTGIYSKWVKKFGEYKAHAMTEYASQLWEYMWDGNYDMSLLDKSYRTMKGAKF